MTQARKEEKNDLDRIWDIYRLDDLLAAVYRGSEYRFGDLHFAEPLGEGKYPEYMAEPPECMKGGWTRHHEIPMVLHPEKGALLLRTAWSGEEEPPELLTERIEEVHSELTNLEWKICKRLEADPYWQNRPIVLGVGVVTSRRVPERLRPANVPEVAILDRDALPRFGAHIDALFEHYTTPSAETIEKWGSRLVDEITGEETRLGGFVGEESLIEAYEDWGHDFEGLVERLG